MRGEGGLGLGNVRDPGGTLGADWVEMTQPVLDEEETAVRQVARLGYAPSDVRLHCGDAYYYHREIENPSEVHPLLDVVQTSSEVHRDLRLGTQARLRELARYLTD
ncbi:hypothetical protein [Streptomyces sp. NPDC048436]|uniref:hypothetical protein n=1 Tax=Streptomyces sp. NPDC048436 TaxID=3365550 RepID=UPI00371E5CE5